MKKNFCKWMAILVAVFSSSVALSSCSDDDEPKDDKLVEKLQGTWTFYHATVTAAGQTIEFGASDLNDLASSMGVSGFYDDVLTFDGMKVNGTDYQVDGNRLKLPYYDDFWFVVSFTDDDTLNLDLEITESGITVKERATYKKRNTKAGFVPTVDQPTIGLFRTLPNLR